MILVLVVSGCRESFEEERIRMSEEQIFIHPEWSEENVKHVRDGEVWLGMTIEQIRLVFGQTYCFELGWADECKPDYESADGVKVYNQYGWGYDWSLWFRNDKLYDWSRSPHHEYRY